MINSWVAPAEWAQPEFAFAPWGDVRRKQRLGHSAQKLAANPRGTLPQAFPDWAELKGAYRFFSAKGAAFDGIIGSPVERTQSNCREPGEYLLIADTTLGDYSHPPATPELGHGGDGNGRGFALPSALAVRVESWTLEQRPEGTLGGLFGQRCRPPRPVPIGETRQQRLSRPRKSQRWAEAFKTAGVPPAGAPWIYLADRGSDFYEPIELLPAAAKRLYYSSLSGPSAGRGTRSVVRGGGTSARAGHEPGGASSAWRRSSANGHR